MYLILTVMMFSGNDNFLYYLLLYHHKYGYLLAILLMYPQYLPFLKHILQFHPILAVVLIDMHYSYLIEDMQTVSIQESNHLCYCNIYYNSLYMLCCFHMNLSYKIHLHLSYIYYLNLIV